VDGAQLLTIGQVGRLAGRSTKALRHYDWLGSSLRPLEWTRASASYGVSRADTPTLRTSGRV